MLLKFAILDFVDDRKLNNSSEANLRNIHYSLNQFNDFCIRKNKLNLEEVKPEHIKEYLMECYNRGNKAGTINTHILRIRSFFNYCVSNDYIKKSPASGVKKVRTDTVVNYFTDEQIEQMLGYYRNLKRRNKQLYSYRDYTLIIFLLSTGFRRAEVCNLKWSDVDLQNRTVKVFGKNKILQTVAITEKLSKELASYYLFTARYFKERGVEDVEYVFTNIYGEQLTRNAIHQMFKSLRKKMNFKDVRLSCHTFRHTYCNRLVSAGLSPFAIMKLMRHQSIGVTMRYVNIWDEELRELNERFNPANNLIF